MKKITTLALATILSGCSSVVITDGVIDKNTKIVVDSCSVIVPKGNTQTVSYISDRCSVSVGFPEPDAK